MREVKFVARMRKSALAELYDKRSRSQTSVLPWFVADAAGQHTRGHVGPDGIDASSTTERTSVSDDCSLCLVNTCLYPPIGKRTRRLQELWSDGLFRVWQHDVPILTLEELLVS